MVSVAGSRKALLADVSFEQEISRFKNNNFSNYRAVCVPAVSVGVAANLFPQTLVGIDFAVP
jgi:hypothetical protein